jgi:hypothetical protein
MPVFKSPEKFKLGSPTVPCDTVIEDTFTVEFHDEDPEPLLVNILLLPPRVVGSVNEFPLELNSLGVGII